MFSTLNIFLLNATTVLVPTRKEGVILFLRTKTKKNAALQFESAPTQ